MEWPPTCRFGFTSKASSALSTTISGSLPRSVLVVLSKKSTIPVGVPAVPGVTVAVSVRPGP